MVWHLVKHRDNFTFMFLQSIDQNQVRKASAAQEKIAKDAHLRNKNVEDLERVNKRRKRKMIVLNMEH
jgi:hypothetical protein